jgi:hypothetical protein
VKSTLPLRRGGVPGFADTETVNGDTALQRPQPFARWNVSECDITIWMRSDRKRNQTQPAGVHRGRVTPLHTSDCCAGDSSRHFLKSLGCNPLVVETLAEVMPVPLRLHVRS